MEHSCLHWKIPEPNNWDVAGCPAESHIDPGINNEIKFNITSSIDRVVKLRIQRPGEWI